MKLKIWNVVRRRSLLIITALVLLDQITKLLFVLFLKDSITITNFLSIEITHNHSLAIWPFKDWEWLKNNIVILRFVGLICMIVVFKNWFVLPKILLISGCIGNFMDGIIYGYVIDLLAISLSVPLNKKLIIYCINIADIYSFLGAAVFSYMYLHYHKSHK